MDFKLCHNGKFTSINSYKTMAESEVFSLIGYFLFNSINSYLSNEDLRRPYEI
jgi:hypothetical protein